MMSMFHQGSLGLTASSRRHAEEVFETPERPEQSSSLALKQVEDEGDGVAGGRSKKGGRNGTSRAPDAGDGSDLDDTSAVSLQLGLQRFHDTQYATLHFAPATSNSSNKKDATAGVEDKGNKIQKSTSSSSQQRRAKRALAKQKDLEQNPRQRREERETLQNELVTFKKTLDAAAEMDDEGIALTGVQSRAQLEAMRREVNTLLEVLENGRKEEEEHLLEESPMAIGGSSSASSGPKLAFEQPFADLSRNRRKDEQQQKRIDLMLEREERNSKLAFDSLQQSLEACRERIQDTSLVGGLNSSTPAGDGKGQGGPATSTTPNKVYKIYLDEEEDLRAEGSTTAALKLLENQVTELEKRIFGKKEPDENAEPIHARITRLSSLLRTLDVGRVDAVTRSVAQLRQQISDPATQEVVRHLAEERRKEALQREAKANKNRLKNYTGKKRKGALFYSTGGSTSTSSTIKSLGGDGEDKHFFGDDSSEDEDPGNLETLELSEDPEVQLEQLYRVTEDIFSVSGSLPHLVQRAATLREYQTKEKGIEARVEQMEKKQAEMREILRAANMQLDALTVSIDKSVTTMHKNLAKFAGS
ncbi:unnamed protein product [Amoebophrya sp. A25]|nr:unnamed protein product [Amoebophrya sp. A25]|eukprot:GSA25T00025768001.1